MAGSVLGSIEDESLLKPVSVLVPVPREDVSELIEVSEEKSVGISCNESDGVVGRDGKLALGSVDGCMLGVYPPLVGGVKPP